MTEPFDLIIRGGTVYDGTGTSPVRADVALRGDRIAAVGEVTGDAARVIDATGMAVSPGFVDVHAHDDAAVLSTPMDFKLMQGVTTDIVGNCGAGVAPVIGSGSRGLPGVEVVLGPMPDATWTTFGEYMDAVERAKPAINVGAFVPHGIVRARHLAMDNRAPDPAELEAMRADVDEGMAAGALGMSTGLIYAPGLFASTDELVALSEVVAKHGGIYMSHIRNEADGLLDAIEEAISIGRDAGLPVEVSHHKASAPSAWGKTADSIRMIEEARTGGLDVTWDAYPYTAGSTILAAARAIREEIDADAVMVSSVREHREYEGKTLREIGEIINVEDPHEIIARVLSEEPAAVAIFFSMDEADVRRVLAHPLCMIGSDGIPSPTGKPHPRLYGTFARVLGTYCREVGLFPLEEAVRKMTSLPAQRMNLSERGELREGWFADIVIFDAERVDDIATYQEPRQYPTGIEYVVINGEVAAERGKQTATHAGRLLRRGQS